MGACKDYDRQVAVVHNLHSRVDQFEGKILANEAASATIFKLLRINYALMHQDEADKQNIFLTGYQDVEGDIKGTKKKRDKSKDSDRVNDHLASGSDESITDNDPNAEEELREGSEYSRQFNTRNTSAKPTDKTPAATNHVRNNATKDPMKILSFDKACLSCAKPNGRQL